MTLLNTAPNITPDSAPAVRVALIAITKHGAQQTAALAQMLPTASV
jgi:hypothetical protein